MTCQPPSPCRTIELGWSSYEASIDGYEIRCPASAHREQRSPRGAVQNFLPSSHTQRRLIAVECLAST